MEERHRAVADVVALESVGLGGAPGDGGQAPLGAAHGLGVAGRARREEQQEEVVGRRPSRHGSTPASRRDRLEPAAVVGRCRRAGCDRGGRRGRGRRGARAPPSSVTRSWQSVKRMSRASSCAASGGVDPDHRRSGQRGAAQPEEVFGDVVEKDADVERAGSAQRRRQRGAAAALGHDLAPASRWRRRSARPGRSSSLPGRQELGHGAGPDGSVRGARGTARPVHDPASDATIGIVGDAPRRRPTGVSSGRARWASGRGTRA